MADDFDFLDTFGISTAEAEQPKNVYDKFLLEVGNKVTSDLRDYIKTNVSNTGGLASSVVYVPNGALTFEIQADDYFKFQDEGVNAVGTNNKGSIYSFNYPGVSPRMAKAIQQWKGFDLSHAYAVASSIKQHGISPKNIIDNVLSEKTLDAIARDLAEVTGLMFTINFEKDTKQWQ
jgi:hypothetical protein